MFLTELGLFPMSSQILRKLEHIHFSSAFLELALNDAISSLVNQDEEEELGEADGSLLIAVY